MLKMMSDLFAKLSVDVWTYVAIAIIVAVFIAGLVLSLIGGDANKFEKYAKEFLKDPSAKNANATAAKMPLKVRKLYKRSRTTGEKPSDVIGVDACVNTPHMMSMTSKYTKAVLLVSLLCLPIAYVGGMLGQNADLTTPYSAMGLVSIVGLILTFVAGVISTLLYKRLVKHYYAYVDKLDALSKGGSFDGEISVNENANEEQPVSQNMNDVNAFGDAEPIVDNNEVDNSERFKTFEMPTRLNVEIIEDEETIENVVAEPPVKNEALNEIDEEIRREKELAEERQRERNAMIEKAKAQAEERKRVAEATANASTVPPVATAPPVNSDEPTEQPQAQEAVQVVAGSSSAELLIARIERISREGASLPEMKETATQLQKERANPSHDPEVKKRLNESLSLLLKAMSSANKK